MPVLRHGELEVWPDHLNSMSPFPPGLSDPTPKGMWHHLPVLLPSPLEDSRVLCGTLGQCLGGP